MTIKIDFHLLAENEDTARLRYVCRLVEKAYGLGHKIYINCDTTENLNALNDLLWIFHDVSFLPHAIYDPKISQEEMPILLGLTQEPPTFAGDVFINLTTTIPTSYQKFQRIIEVVCNTPSQKELARARYKQYKTQHQEITIHDFSNHDK